jgi:digalactosyldiacylglycerol synthase
MPPRHETIRPDSAAEIDVAVISTAALPWRTGPAFFALWHACGLAALGRRTVLVVPWLGAGSQRRLWNRVLFDTPGDQARWLVEEAERLGAPPLPEVRFYRGYYAGPLASIVALADVYAAVPDARAYVLQEPEHLHWFPTSRPRRRLAAERVVGIVMTNYGHYIRAADFPGCGLVARFVEWRHARLMRAHTDFIVPLSQAVALNGLGHPMRMARVTGVVSDYARVAPVEAGNRGVFFLGRLVWNKGLAAVIETAKRMDLEIDVLGEGPDRAAIERRAADRGAPVRFLGSSDSPWRDMANYRVFFNPSLSEVLCSTTMEALVAGRHVVLPECAANDPFRDYPNAHFYSDADGAVAALRHALAVLPETPVKARREFDWMTACRTLDDML